LPLNTEVEWPLWIAWQSLLALIEIGNLHAIEVGLITLVTCVIAQQFERPAQLGHTDRHRGRNPVFPIPERDARSAKHADRANRQSVVDPFCRAFAAAVQPGGDAGRHCHRAGAVTLALLGLFQTVAAMRRMSRKIGGFTDSRKAIFLRRRVELPAAVSLVAAHVRIVQPHVARAQLGIHSRLAIISSALWLLLLVMFFARLIAIIPMPAMAAESCCSAPT
jgi:SulP family sulfate permease